MTNNVNKICLNCGYERQAKDESAFIPESECPKCRAIYKKVEKFIKEKEEKEEEKLRWEAEEQGRKEEEKLRWEEEEQRRKENVNHDILKQIVALNDKITQIESNSRNSTVTISDIKMPFDSMVSFMVKWIIASIPAAIIILIIAAIVGGVFRQIIG